MAKAKPQSAKSQSKPQQPPTGIGLRQQIAWATQNNPTLIPGLLAKGKTYQYASAYTKHRWENTAKKLPSLIPEIEKVRDDHRSQVEFN